MLAKEYLESLLKSNMEQLDKRIFLLIDANALIHRAFHALPGLTNSFGKPVNALYGFASMLLKILQELMPTHVAAAFDLAGPTFRDELFAEYKATRVRGPSELYDQIPLVKDFLRKIGITVLEYEGFEADDIIGTLAAKSGELPHGTNVIILTGDLDTLQLVGERVSVLTLKKGISETILYDEKAVEKRYGFKSKFLPDFKGLKGDPSDNIPGVKGIGEKTAAVIIKQFGHLEDFYAYLDKNPKSASLKIDGGKIGGTVLAALRAQRDEAFFSKMLGSIRLDVPIILQEQDFRFNFDVKIVRKELLALGFQSLARRLESVFTKGAEQDSSVKIATLQAMTVADPSASQIKGFITKAKKEKTFFFIAEGNSCLFSVFEERKLAISLYFTVKENNFLPKNLADLFSDDSLLCVGYGLENIPRDAVIKNKIFDIAVAAWLLNPDEKKNSVEKMSRRYLYKEYSAGVISELYEILLKKLREFGLENVFFEIETPTFFVLRDMEKSGIKVKRDALEKVRREIEELLPDLSQGIYKSAGEEFNINSSKALREILFEKLRLASKGIRRTPSGVLSTDSGELEKLKMKHPIIEKVLLYRELQKINSTYTESIFQFINKISGRVHPRFIQIGTATGRLSCESPNLQNIPTRGVWAAKIRKAFISEKGFSFAAFDYSQLELRIVAEFSKDQVMIDAFQKGEDIHKRTAAEINKLDSLEAVTPEMRFRAKALNFGLIYGMGPKAFSESAGISFAEAKLFIARYFERFKGVKDFIDNLKEHARTHGYVETPTGRKRFIPEISSGGFRERSAAERVAVNMPIQGFGADLIKLAMIRAREKFISRGLWGKSVKPLLQIHDELLFEIDNDIIKEETAVIKSIMENAWEMSVPLSVEVKIGLNWWEVTKN